MNANQYINFFDYCELRILQAMEDGNLDEVLEEEEEKKTKKKPRPKKPRKSEAAATPSSSRKRKEPKPRERERERESSPVEDDEPKEKKRRGRPPVEKATPNSPKLTKLLKRLYSLVVNYKDRLVLCDVKWCQHE